MMDGFFDQKCIKIHNEKGEEIQLYMRPMKIKELPLLMRIHQQAEDNPKTPAIDLSMQFLELIGQTIDIEPQDDWIVEDLIDEFIKYNFPDIEKKTKSSKDNDKSFEMAFDFLICQGHNLSEIMEYTLPQFLAFQNTALDRLTGYQKPKKMGPIDLANKIGIKVKRG